MATTRRILSIVLIAIGTFINEANAVVGGDDAASGEFTFAVQLILNGTNGEETLCGGTIISERHILTAAHCFRNRTSAKVLSGVQNYSADDAVVTRGARMIPHPDFKTQPYGADIGILVLEKDLELGQRQNAIPLATEAPSDDVWAWFAGWGGSNDENWIQPEIIEKIPVGLSNSPECNRLDEVRTWLCGKVEKSFLCFGDSGSGLVRGGTVIGVASSALCNGTDYDYYTSVFHHRNWINSTIYISMKIVN